MSRSDCAAMSCIDAVRIRGTMSWPFLSASVQIEQHAAEVCVWDSFKLASCAVKSPVHPSMKVALQWSQETETAMRGFLG